MLPLLLKIYKSHPEHRFSTLVVDDNSLDGTALVVQNFKKKYSKTILLQGEKKGLGVAMTRGYVYALAHLLPDVVVTIDADFVVSPEKIPYMVNKIEKGYDVVLASRHVHGGSSNWGILRSLNHFVANTICATWVAGVTQAKDHNACFRAIRVKGVLDQIDFDNIRISGFGFFNYMIFLLSKQTSAFYEFPSAFRDRTSGSSKINVLSINHLKNVVEYITSCLHIRMIKILG